MTGEKLDSAKALQNIYNEISLGEIGELYDSLHNEDAHEIMIEAGYDGIISRLGDDEAEYVVFNASQINILSIERPMSLGRSGR